ncbi:hypothetical protein PYCCODRAFT_1467787 [Trametes coccinea BRFM310]|uniref:Uncharacterized protein n=1 Tax=Trametes coccinea (strain BRFM310) TaxID=1353009 RepID=A0A1Y2IMV3_TRAC3|nr:hypothetical protein PYCCODRAFT_1467787 [Trametes coccinea BRFM310]
MNGSLYGISLQHSPQNKSLRIPLIDPHFAFTLFLRVPLLRALAQVLKLDLINRSPLVDTELPPTTISGKDPYGQLCIDSFGVESRVCINLPPGHSLHPGTVPSIATCPGYYPPLGVPTALNRPTFAMSGPLQIWNRNTGMKEIPEGEEMWMVPQGAYLVLRRDGHRDVVFQIPILQPAFVRSLT